MPNYDFRCESCQKQEEVFMRIADYKAPECCGKKMNQVLGNYSVVKDVDPYLDENIADKPVWVKSKQHRKQLMKEHGVYEKFGKGWW